MQTAVGVFGGEACTDETGVPPLMNNDVGDSGRPAISSLNAPPFIAVELCREHLVCNDDDSFVTLEFDSLGQKSIIPLLSFNNLLVTISYLFLPKLQEDTEPVIRKYLMNY